MRLLPLLVVMVAACAPRGPAPDDPTCAHASVMLDPPFTLTVAARGAWLDVHVVTRRPLAGSIELALTDEASLVTTRGVAARTGSFTLPSPGRAWRLTASWRDPSDAMGATAIVSATTAPDPSPTFEPIVPLRVGALRVDAAIPVARGGR